MHSVSRGCSKCFRHSLRLCRGEVLINRCSAASAGTSMPKIQDLAKLAQIDVSDKEAAEWQPKIDGIIDWFGQLQKADVSGLSPAIHATDKSTPLRPDEPQLHKARAELLAMAPALENGFFRVPKIGAGAAGGAGAAPKDAVPATGAMPAAPSTSTAAAAGSPGTGQDLSAGIGGPSSSSAATPSAAPSSSSPSSPTATPSASDLASFHALDLRVGRIVSCERHPDAENLYVEKIDVGEPEARTIVSGLVKFVPIEQMQGRAVVVICNLKPRNMRGIKSAGMVLAASNEDHSVVEPLQPPEGAVAGDRVYAGDVKDQPAPAAANAVEKKKLWEAVQPGLATATDRVVTWRGMQLRVDAGMLTSATLVGARVA